VNAPRTVAHNYLTHFRAFGHSCITYSDSFCMASNRMESDPCIFSSGMSLILSKPLLEEVG
jgi:hypothetical protein